MNSKKKVILIILLIVMMLLAMIVYTLQLIKKMQNEQKVNNDDLEIVSNHESVTIKEIIEKHESNFIEEKNYTIYADFKKDLFDDNGKSNEEYFENIVEDLAKLEQFDQKTFYLEDEKKSIHISAEYKFELKKHVIIYNHTEDYFEKANNNDYSKVDKVEIIEKVQYVPSSDELSDLVDGNFFFNSIKDDIGEGIDLENGYTSYKDDSVLIRMQDFKIKNIIFTEKYTEPVFSGITVGTKLEEIEKKLNNSYSGSAKEGYIMCRTKDVYAFFYEDEIVIYGYSYYEESRFEDFLENYLQTGDLKTFIEKVTKKWENYDICEYDFDAQSAHITYPSRGVEINIKNNNPLGITFYNNYYFSSRMRDFVKAGKVSMNEKVDYLEYTEKNRRNNSEE